MKNIAVVGGTASLSKYLIPVLAKKNEVILLGRKNCDLYCDLLEDLDSIKLPEEIEVLIHVAAAFKGSTDDEIVETEEVNALGTLKLCIAAKNAGVKHFILISSIYSNLRENSPNYNIYSISKRHAEDLALYYCKKYILPLTILRASPLYDTQSQYRYHQPLIFMMADKAEYGGNIEIYGKNDALRNYLHVEDFVTIISKVIENKVIGEYTCTYKDDITLSEIAEAAQKAFKKGGEILFIKDKQDIPDNISEYNAELYKKIGYYPKIDIECGMEKIAHFRQNGKI